MIRILPPEKEEVKSGVIQFEGDLPGLFLKGEDLYRLYFVFEMLEKYFVNKEKKREVEYAIELLKALKEIAQPIVPK